jgi:hypothetical protein
MQNYTTKRNHIQCKRKRHVYLKTIADWKDMSSWWHESSHFVDICSLKIELKQNQ